MKKLSLALAVLAAVGLSACSSFQKMKMLIKVKSFLAKWKVKILN